MLHVDLWPGYSGRFRDTVLDPEITLSDSLIIHKSNHQLDGRVWVMCIQSDIPTFECFDIIDKYSHKVLMLLLSQLCVF